MEKKNEYVFNIGFNKNILWHRNAVNILNQMGHSKADYIAKAVMFYHKQDEKSSGNGLSIDYRNLEQMVRKILDDQKEESSISTHIPEKSQKNGADNVGEIITQEPELKEEDMMGIMHALQGFRK